ncbi:stalk domain-containing protein [Ammoniphilus sp. CFH 90114]|uniref:stalk domain-containing protein n=1 Tax=Ammoniphilus sp. CFH 90114 TaxID=2493665 RepID=UPI0013E97595|nr:stalk domain-containing protein [Ammoniphilus sp. CFH 90114]
MRRNPKRLGVAVVALVTALSLSTPISEAAQKNQKVEAQYRDIKILYNNNQVVSTLEPFIIAGTTYLPLSMMADVFNKNVYWDGSTKTISVTDKANPQLEQLRVELATKNTNIADLTAQLSSKDTRIADLEKRLESREYDEADLEELEEELNDEYGEWEDMDFRISIDGDEDDIDVEIKVDLDDYDEEWSDLSNREIEGFVEDILDDIWNEYDDADISGSIIDRSENEEVVEFSGEDGDVDVDITRSGDRLSDLEDDLKDTYEDYFDDIRLTVYLNGSTDDVQFVINVAYQSYKEEWDDLTESEIDRLLDDVADDIADEFEDADIEGYIYDTDNQRRLAEY